MNEFEIAAIIVSRFGKLGIYGILIGLFTFCLVKIYELYKQNKLFNLTEKELDSDNLYIFEDKN